MAALPTMPRRPMSTLHRLIAMLLLLAGCASANESVLTLTDAQIQALGIETRSDASETLRGSRLPARVTIPTAQMRVVATPLAGIVDRLLFAPGESVRRGQPLAQLSSREALELQRDTAQATAQSALLKQNLARDEQLFAEGLIAEARLQATRAAALQAESQANERRQGAQLAGADSRGKLSPTLTLNAPITGVVLEQGAQTGQRVEAASMLYRIATLSPLWLEIQAPLTVATGLRPGQQLRITDPPMAARLITIGRTVDLASQSVVLRAEVNEGADRLTPGQMLSVELPSAPKQAANTRQTLPAAAVIRDGERSLVFVLAEGKAKTGERQFLARVVSVISQGGERITVDGLRAEETIVVRGASGLKAMLTGVGRD